MSKFSNRTDVYDNRKLTKLDLKDLRDDNWTRLSGKACQRFKTFKGRQMIPCWTNRNASCNPAVVYYIVQCLQTCMEVMTTKSPPIPKYTWVTLASSSSKHIISSQHEWHMLTQQNVSMIFLQCHIWSLNCIDRIPSGTSLWETN